MRAHAIFSLITREREVRKKMRYRETTNALRCEETFALDAERFKKTLARMVKEGEITKRSATAKERRPPRSAE